MAAMGNDQHVITIEFADLSTASWAIANDDDRVDGVLDAILNILGQPDSQRI